MAKLVQICASANDLFGLDGDGVVYQYNFKTNNWVRLGRGQRDHGGSPSIEGEPTIAHPEGADRPEGELTVSRRPA